MQRSRWIELFTNRPISLLKRFRNAYAVYTRTQSPDVGKERKKAFTTLKKKTHAHAYKKRFRDLQEKPFDLQFKNMVKKKKIFKIL